MAALIVAVSTLRLWPFLEGRLPGVGDHAVHLHKLWFLWERLLPRGRLSGWSSYWFLGEPVGDLYPPGQDLWSAAVHALTLGQLSWERSYGLAFAGFYVLSAWCLYDLGRRFFGRFAGFVAALLWLLDPGAWEQGGWHYQVFYGVWGQALAQTLLLPALWRVIRFLEEGRRADLGLAGLLLGLSLLCHPMNLLLIGLVGVALVLAWRVRDGLGMARLGAAIGLGLLVSATFLLPFLARSAYARNIGGAGLSADEVLTELSRGELLTGFPVAVSVLALLGAGLLVGRGDRLGRALAAVLAALLVLRTEWVSSLPWSDLPGPDLSNLMWRRFSVPARSIAFLLAGVGAAAALAWAGQLRASAARGAAGMLTLGALSLGVFAWGQQAVKDGRDLPMLDEIPLYQGYNSWLKWSRAAWDEREDFYRVAFLFHPHDHRLMASTIQNRTPILKIGYTPAHLSLLSPDRASEALFRAASVRWLLTDHTIEDARFEPVQHWGTLELYAFTPYRPERYTLHGAGFVETLTFEDERVALRVSGAAEGSRLVLHVADFPRWRARMNGQDVEIRRAPLWEGGEPIGMSVPVRDGILTFEYVRRPLDGAAMALSAAGVALCLWLMRRPGQRAPLLRYPARWRAS